jgi:hypothetical protein
MIQKTNPSSRHHLFIQFSARSEAIRPGSIDTLRQPVYTNGATHATPCAVENA